MVVTVSGLAGDMTATAVSDWARLSAALMVLACFAAYTLLTRWWKDASLLATWVVFTGLLSVLTLAVTSRYEWYPEEWKPWVTAGVWLFVTALFAGWLGAYLWTQIRPVMLERRAHRAHRERV